MHSNQAQTIADTRCRYEPAGVINEGG